MNGQVDLCGNVGGPKGTEVNSTAEYTCDQPEYILSTFNQYEEHSFTRTCVQNGTVEYIDVEYQIVENITVENITVGNVTTENVTVQNVTVEIRVPKNRTVYAWSEEKPTCPSRYHLYKPK